MAISTFHDIISCFGNIAFQIAKVDAGTSLTGVYIMSVGPLQVYVLISSGIHIHLDKVTRSIALKKINS